MASKLRVCLVLVLFFILCGLGAHVAGFLTEYWLTANRDVDTTTNTTVASVKHVHMGLFKETIEFSNGTVSESESSLNIKEENYIFLAIAGSNTFLCLILICKAVHVFIGVVSFVCITLQFIVAFYCFEHTKAKLDMIQDFEHTWPQLNFAWSFMLLFAGILLNLVSTAVFLTLLLIRGEIKASKSTKGLGPNDVHTVTDKTPIVSMIAHENKGYSEYTAYNNQLQSDHEYECIDGQATPISAGILPCDIQLEERTNKADSYSNKDDFPDACNDLDALDDSEVIRDNAYVNSVTESAHF